MLEIALALIFISAYLCIAFEHQLRVNKAAPALLAAAASWCLLAIGSDIHIVQHALPEHVADIAGIIFFIMGAMTIVEVIDARGGFVSLKRIFNGKAYGPLTWLLGGATFFLSAVLDNLTTAIVMTSVVVKLVDAQGPRMLLAGLVIVAANAGGAWSPIGDVTTTMLWVDNRISTLGVVVRLILPSLVATLIPILLVAYLLRKEPPPSSASNTKSETPNTPVLVGGILLLLSVPFIKTVFHVPPFIAMLAALSVLWAVSDILHRKVRHSSVRPVASALGRIDMASALFFLGILLAVAALDSAGILRNLATAVQGAIPDERVVAAIIGVVSAIVDNVPLVAGAIGMYDPATYPLDHQFWIFLAYCAGTGGSMLVIGSAAGVAAMGIARLEFGWYARVIGPIALAGYIGGFFTLVLQYLLFP